MHNPDIGKLILRLTLGILMLFHGVAKLSSGVAGIKGMLAGVGLPEFIAYGVFVGEIIAPLMLMIGFYSRVGAALIIVNMLFAIGLAHTGDIFALTGHGGWALELQAFFMLNAVALIFLGPGRYKWKH